MKAKLSVFVWNFQGCASRKFSHIFREYNEEHKSDIISLLEPKVSGNKADEIIAKFELQHSHRVKAKGYLSGIWIGWKDSVRFEVVHNHPQFIVTKVYPDGCTNPLLMSFVYESPNR